MSVEKDWVVKSLEISGDVLDIFSWRSLDSSQEIISHLQISEDMRSNLI